MQLTIQEIQLAVQGVLLQGDPLFLIQGISTDTRKLKKGDFYIALQGPNFDGHDFITDAFAKGASGVLVSKKISPPTKKSFCVLQVDNTLKALGDLAHFWREKFSIPVVAITGSNGKTTTKEMIAACLAQKGKVLKTEGNLNNLIGLPLTVLQLNASYQYCVLEMGMNAFGEIARLTEIARPTLGLITNIGLAHLEGLGSLEGVAKAKEELFDRLSSQAKAVVNRDDPYIVSMKTKAKKISFGSTFGADIVCSEVKAIEGSTQVRVLSSQGESVFKLPVSGDYYVKDWLACYAICSELGLTSYEIQEGIKEFQPPSMRGQEIQLTQDLLIINDTYNANPSSMEVSLQALGERFPHRRKVAVLGEMLELGATAASYHRQVGKTASTIPIDALIAFGVHAPDLVRGFHEESPEKIGDSFQEMDSLTQSLKKILKQGDVILIKGSRGSQMERVVEYLKENFS